MFTRAALAAACFCLVTTQLQGEDKPGEFKPGQKVVVDFGGKSVGEVIEVMKTGWFTVRMKTLGGTELTPTLPPSSLRAADPNAVFGTRMDDALRPSRAVQPGAAPITSGVGTTKPMPPTPSPTAENAGEFRPGQKVVVDFGGESIGEVIEVTKSGWIKVRMKSVLESEMTPTLPPNRLRIADANAVYGTQLDTKPQPSNPLSAEKKFGEFKFGQKVVVDLFGKSIGEVVEVLDPGFYRVRIRSAQGREHSWRVRSEKLQPADANAVFGTRLDGEKPRTRTTAPSSTSGSSLGLIATPTTAKKAVVPAELLGSWTVVSVTPDAGPAEPSKLVFTADRCVLGEMPFLYAAIDVQPSPRHIDLSLEHESGLIMKPQLGLFEVQGDELRFCLGPFGAARPQSLGGIAGATLFACKRATDVSTLPLQTAADVDPALLKSLTDLAALLKAQDIRGFLMRGALSPDGQRIPAGVIDQAVKNLPAEQSEQLRVTLEAMLRLKPTFNADRTEAVYDLSKYHIPSGLPKSTVKWKRFEGTWSLMER